MAVLFLRLAVGFTRKFIHGLAVTDSYQAAFGPYETTSFQDVQRRRPRKQETHMTEKKVAIIMAGGSGMGAASVRRLAADGFKVAVLSSSGKGEALAQELGGLGVTGSNQSADDLKRLVDATVEK